MARLVPRELEVGDEVAFKAAVDEFASCRRRGYATEMMHQAVPHARALGLDRLPVTCDDDNVASRAVIERCGGVLEDRRPRDGGGLTRRYWIDLQLR